MTLNLSKYNPFNRGKGKMVAGFMLEGLDNQRIFDYIKDNQLDDKYKTPLSMNFLYSTRYRLRRDGIFEKLERDKLEKKEAEKGKGAETDLSDSDDKANQTLEKNEELSDSPPKGRPEWAVMTTAQIDLIEDPALKAQILEYRTHKERQRQAAQTPYVTNEQLNTFKDEVSGRMTKLEGDLIGIKDGNQQILTAVNKLTGEEGKENPTQETPAPATVNPTTNIAETPDTPFANLSRDEAVDLLLNMIRTGTVPEGMDAGVQVIEAQQPMIRKMIIEVTTFTQMLYEKAIADGAFDGSFSDFPNWAPAKYFEDRNWALGWHRFEPARRM